MTVDFPLKGFRKATFFLFKNVLFWTFHDQFPSEGSRVGVAGALFGDSSPAMKYSKYS